MPLQQTSGNVTADAYGGGVAAVPNYIEDVFSTYLYTGTASLQTINNGIDLSTYGGMVWVKGRNTSAQSATSPNRVFDTIRGAGAGLVTNTTAAQGGTGNLLSFDSSGFSFDTPRYEINGSGSTYASWTFRKQPKFFDVVTFSLNGGGDATFSHSLGSSPGCVLIKSTGITENWYVYHRSLGQSKYLNLNLTGTGGTATNIFQPTATDFTFGLGGTPGATYVAYLFAHNAGGFGLTGTDNVISCGSFTTDSAGNADVTLGYEPQWVLLKDATNAANWGIVDVMRSGLVNQSSTSSKALFPNLSNAESNLAVIGATSTGFSSLGAGTLDTSSTYIYIAIRRGPMKVPTDATKVFIPTIRTDSGSTSTISSGFPPDLVVDMSRSSYSYPTWEDRLRGNTAALYSNVTSAEGTFNYVQFNSGSGSSSYQILSQTGGPINFVDYAFKRAPSFFDEVCYTTGAGTGQTTFNHNLGVTPELVISKVRSAVDDWYVYAQPLGTSKTLYLNANLAQQGFTCTDSLSSTQARTYLGVGSATAVSYLFSTCAGVSKVFSFTGNGTTQTINCGFTGGARFVLLKATSTTGGWFVYDTARGMTTLTDPYLQLNSTAAESATLGSVTTVTTGFAVNESILSGVNTNGVSYIGFAIA